MQFAKIASQESQLVTHTATEGRTRIPMDRLSRREARETFRVQIRQLTSLSMKQTTHIGSEHPDSFIAILQIDHQASYKAWAKKFQSFVGVFPYCEDDQRLKLFGSILNTRIRSYICVLLSRCLIFGDLRQKKLTIAAAIALGHLFKTVPSFWTYVNRQQTGDTSRLDWDKLPHTNHSFPRSKVKNMKPAAFFLLFSCPGYAVYSDRVSSSFSIQ